MHLDYNKSLFRCLSI